MRFLKHFYRTLFLRTDWYFVILSGHETIQIAHWNGTRWDNRAGYIDSDAVEHVLNNVPVVGMHHGEA